MLVFLKVEAINKVDGKVVGLSPFLKFPGFAIPMPESTSCSEGILNFGSPALYPAELNAPIGRSCH